MAAEDLDTSVGAAGCQGLCVGVLESVDGPRFPPTKRVLEFLWPLVAPALALLSCLTALLGLAADM